MLNLRHNYRGKFSDLPLVKRDISLTVNSEVYAGVIHDHVLEFLRGKINSDYFTIEQFAVVSVYSVPNTQSKTLTFVIGFRPEINEPNIAHSIDKVIEELLSINLPGPTLTE